MWEEFKLSQRNEKYFQLEVFSFTPKGPQNKKLWQNIAVEHATRTTAEKLYSVLEGWITLHNRTYRDEFVKSLGWKVVSCNERSLAAGIFMGLLSLFQTHLPQFLPWWRCLCQGFLLWTLSSTLGCHNRNPWPVRFVPSPIHNILLVCFLLAHCDQIIVRIYHHY